jgi:hypothetical protein
MPREVYLVYCEIGIGRIGRNDTELGVKEGCPTLEPMCLTLSIPPWWEKVTQAEEACLQKKKKKNDRS